jgi:hypothetical protein
MAEDEEPCPMAVNVAQVAVTIGFSSCLLYLLKLPAVITSAISFDGPGRACRLLISGVGLCDYKLWISTGQHGTAMV